MDKIKLIKEEFLVSASWRIGALVLCAIGIPLGVAVNNIEYRTSLPDVR
jgi:hypothetical protein